MIRTLLDSDRARAVLPALVPPAAILVAWVLAVGSEPTGASADVEAEPVEAATIDISAIVRPRPEPSVEHAAQTRAQTLGRRFDFESPFFDPGAHAETEPDSDTPAGLPVEVELTSLMNTSRGAIAIINGNPYREGDRIEDIATIEAIDVAARSVTVVTDSGRTVHLDLASPGLKRSD